MAMKELLMANYSVAQTKDNLSALIERARAGEEVVITNRGKPVAKLAPLEQSVQAERNAAMRQLRERIDALGDGGPRIPFERFYDWLYEDED